MSNIPNAITEDDVLDAIADFDRGVKHEFADSTKFDLLYEGRRYPPKAIVGLAARRHVGEPLKPSDFSGGLRSKCFRVLESLGFEIVPKPTASQAWLIQGNPDKFDVDEYLSSLDYIYWNVSRKSPRDKMKVGDRIYFWRAQGRRKAVSGVIGIGTIAEPCKPKEEILYPENDDHSGSDNRGTLWSDDVDGSSRFKVGLRVEEVRLAVQDGMIPRSSLLLDPELRSMSVIRQAHGSIYRVTPDQRSLLDEIWAGVSEASKEHRSTEGTVTQVISTRYERSPEARAACLAHFGYDRQCCGMNFEELYGEIGKHFIHVHHRKPLSEIAGRYEVDPIIDLVPVCPNCHAMLHRTNPPMTVEDLRQRF